MPAKDYVQIVYNIVKEIPTEEICSIPAEQLVEKILNDVLSQLDSWKQFAATTAMRIYKNWTNSIKAEVASQITKLQTEKAIFRDTLCRNKGNRALIKIQEGTDFYSVSYDDAIRILLMDAIILDPNTETHLNQHCTDCDKTWRDIKKISKVSGGNLRFIRKQYKSKNKRIYN
jgi:hypothetical protein